MEEGKVEIRKSCRVRGSWRLAWVHLGGATALTVKADNKDR
jgi:hypothetical protein